MAKGICTAVATGSESQPRLAGALEHLPLYAPKQPACRIMQRAHLLGAGDTEAQQRLPHVHVPRARRLPSETQPGGAKRLVTRRAARAEQYTQRMLPSSIKRPKSERQFAAHSWLSAASASSRSTLLLAYITSSAQNHHPVALNAPSGSRPPPPPTAPRCCSAPPAAAPLARPPPAAGRCRPCTARQHNSAGWGWEGCVP